MANPGAFRDVLLALVIVGGVLGVLYAYTGVWPPMVVVESGSMMHAVCDAPKTPDFCDSQVGYGKFGTIDPGDMVFVKNAPKREEVTTLAEASMKDPGQRNYGKPGDVVVYFPSNARTRTPIIHRAVTYIDAQGVADAGVCERGGSVGDATYSVLWDGRVQVFRAANGGIYLQGLFDERANFRPDAGYKPCWSGFITKGDNPVTNLLPDQALGGGVLPRQPVKLEWIQGKAVGELPWFGLIKLALGSTPNYGCPAGRSVDPACRESVRVLNANAPGDLWTMLGLSLAAIAIAPVLYDVYILKRKPKDKGEGSEGSSRPPESPAQPPPPPPAPPPAPPP